MRPTERATAKTATSCRPSPASGKGWEDGGEWILVVPNDVYVPAFADNVAAVACGTNLED